MYLFILCICLVLCHNSQMIVNSQRGLHEPGLLPGSHTAALPAWAEPGGELQEDADAR